MAKVIINKTITTKQPKIEVLFSYRHNAYGVYVSMPKWKGKKKFLGIRSKKYAAQGLANRYIREYNQKVA